MLAASDAFRRTEQVDDDDGSSAGGPMTMRFPDPVQTLRRPLRLAVLALAAALAGCANGYVSVSDRLDASDLALAASATQGALENNKVGESANWHNPANGHLGTVTPTRTMNTAAGLPCRDLQLTATVEGRTIFAYDTACRGADGAWRSKNYATLAQAIRDGDSSAYGRPYPPHYYDPWCRSWRDPFCSGPYYGSSLYYGRWR